VFRYMIRAGTGTAERVRVRFHRLKLITGFAFEGTFQPSATARVRASPTLVGVV